MAESELNLDQRRRGCRADFCGLLSKIETGDRDILANDVVDI